MLNARNATAHSVVTNSFDPVTGGRPRGGVRLHGGDGALLAPLAPPIAGAGRSTVPAKFDDAIATTGTSRTVQAADLLLWSLPSKLAATGSPLRLHQGFHIVWNASEGAEGAESRLLPAINRHQRYLGGLLRRRANG
jgi:hypothetical protein